MSHRIDLRRLGDDLDGLRRVFAGYSLSDEKLVTASHMSIGRSTGFDEVVEGSF